MMASVERRERNGVKRWYARYRTPDGKQRTKTFDRKVDADRFLVTVEGSKQRGAFVDPQRQTITVGEWADKWLAGKANLAPKTRETYEMMSGPVLICGGDYDSLQRRLYGWTAGQLDLGAGYGVQRRVAA